MNILILGGGPGGLYAAILLKKAHPDWRIDLVERNPHDATYGWGIVFSDRTLSSFREADPKSSKELADRFVPWEVIEVRHRSAVVRCGGNAFAGMSRKALLEVLQRRARELGVALAFRREVDDPSSLEGYDLCVAADGANSFARRSHESVFRPRIEHGRARYAWFGTGQVFDAFTFLFRETEHGLFQAHVYPHVGTVATMIVECSEAAWRSAGLDRASEAESVAFCEDVFHRDLGGRDVYANKSDWQSFATIRNRTWRCGRIVLLGDAAHTAHFGIGSGTKLAMEDAIALAAACDRHGDDVDRALDDYELERRPVVEALQEAALESQEYFENTARYLDFHPVAFAFHLMTRSSRITYGEIRRRDSAFADQVDRVFLESQIADGRPPGQLRVAPPPAFTSLRLRGTELPNRVVVSSPPIEDAQDGLPGEGASAALVACALGGAGLVMSDVFAVAPEGRITAGSPGLYRAESAAMLRQLAGLVHVRGAKLGVQLGHAGRRGSMESRSNGLDRPLREGGWPTLSPSAVPYGPARPAPVAMIRRDLDRVRDDFVRAARLADQAGADLLQLHFAQGELLWSFFSPLSNQRADEYGGSLERRTAYPIEVFEAVRGAWPHDKPLAVALSSSEWLRGGIQTGDVVEIARMLGRRGCDLVYVITGLVQLRGTPRYDPYASALASDRVRNEARIRTVVGARSGTTDEMNGILASGRADLCLLAPLPDRRSMA